MAGHSAKLGCQSTMRSIKPSTLTQLILLASILSVKVIAVCGTSLSAPELRISVDSGSSADSSGSVSDTPIGGGGILENAKRSWQSLQGSWGKRGVDFAGNNYAIPPLNADGGGDDDKLILAADWVPVMLGNGDHLNPQMREALVYVVNANTLERLANEKQLQQQQQQLFAEELTNPDILASSYEVAEPAFGGSSILNEKRAWKNLNAGWGKRRNAPAWNKFSGAWGKREPGWNNLKGMWGKRAAKDWQKLHGGWGKR